jgi:hypothetical protein
MPKGVGRSWRGELTRVEEVHARDDECVDDSKNDVGLIPDGLEGDRGDHYDHEVENPISRGGQGISRSSDTKRDDLSLKEGGKVSTFFGRILGTPQHQAHRHQRPA